jgi:aspartyl-tRNA(Asn)/glutamyl-tRNA(Gln) amidotransferase subunit C
MSKSKIIDKETVTKISDLIKIRIKDPEVEKYESMLNTVLDSVRIMEDIDTSDVEITSQTHGLKNVLREDKPKPGLDMTKYKNNKNFKNGYFIVDKVI